VKKVIKKGRENTKQILKEYYY